MKPSLSNRAGTGRQSNGKVSTDPAVLPANGQRRQPILNEHGNVGDARSDGGKAGSGDNGHAGVSGGADIVPSEAVAQPVGTGSGQRDRRPEEDGSRASNESDRSTARPTNDPSLKDRVEQILERELSKLDAMSRLSMTGLALEDVRRLDVLIKCYSSFIGPLDKKNDRADAPENQSTEDLLKDVLKVYK